MRKKSTFFKILGLTLLFLFMGKSVSAQKSKLEKKAFKSLKRWENPVGENAHMGKIALDSLAVNKVDKAVEVYFNKALAYWPWREELEQRFRQDVSGYLKGKLKSYKIKVIAGGREINELVPNIYKTSSIDRKRLSIKGNKPSYVKREGGLEYDKGLSENFIALWHSHGWYYESKLDRWEWQRARLYGSVEDISPMQYVIPYITPMLENAGATVFLPRERSFRKEEVIVDNDRSSEGSQVILEPGITVSDFVGFLKKDTLYPGENPFEMGTSLAIKSAGGKVATYLPNIPQKGMYELYISYRQSKDYSEKVVYKVKHTGGSTSFTINQTMGGGTWVYLGKFDFNKGKNIETGSIEVLSNGERLSIDAIKMGGGMGNVARRPADETVANQWSLKSGQSKDTKAEKVNPEDFGWKTSQRPRYMEGARYWLQYAGMPDTLVFSLNDEKNDYNDDYQSRGEWVDYLMGAPNGPTKDRKAKGLNIPIDLAFAFHTDAGITPDDSIIGTLGIYSSTRDGGLFPNGQSKMASRDMTDIIQTQIVDDIRALYNNEWTRRGMWDKQYSEAWRPNVPTMLLELFSHQNLADMKFGLDPRFRFDVSRAVYKGMLKFLANQEGREYVVQPLPVDHMAIEKVNGSFVLSWQPVLDPLEVSAVPDKYKVYRRIGDNGFDNGVVVEGTLYRIPNVAAGINISYKVTAVNEGGESMPSEILSMGIAKEDAPVVLAVSAFDRVCGPAFVEENNFAGVAWWEDQGVAYRFDHGFTGFQYDYNRKSAWLDDDSPGWGASYGDMEGKPVLGNSFDNVLIHGKSILRAGFSYVSVSDEVFENKDFAYNSYHALDIVLGEEKTTPGYLDTEDEFKIYTRGFIDKVTDVTAAGKSVFMSGAYVGSDIHFNNDTVAGKFAKDVLHFKWRTNHAANNGKVVSSDYVNGIFDVDYEFNTGYHPEVYTVEAPDAIEPEGKGAVTSIRYQQNNSSAGISYQGKYNTVVWGVPFETVVGQESRDAVMKEILKFL